MDGLTVASRPYPWPWHGDFEARRTALLVVRDGDGAAPTRATWALLRSLTELAARTGVMVVALPRQSPASPDAEFGTDIRVVRDRKSVV